MESVTISGHTLQTIPLSIAQRGLWVGQKIGSDKAVFNIAEAIEIHGPIDPVLFVAALHRLTREMETVRVRIVEGPNGPRQVVMPHYDGDFPVIDVSAEADPKAAAERWMMEDVVRPVDFDHDILWRCALFRAAPDRFIWYHRSHHICLDGFTGGMVARRLAALYTAMVAGDEPEPVNHPPLAELLKNEMEYRASDRFARDQDYWRTRLAGLPDAVSLAKRRASTFGGLYRKTAYISPESTKCLHSMAKNAAGSLPQILIALAAAFFFRATGAADLVFGLPVTARPSGFLRRIPGMVANAVPIRLAMSPWLTLDALIQQVSATVRQALRHQQYRYEDLRRDLGLVGRDQQISWLGVNIEPFDYDFRFAGHPGIPFNLSNGSVEDLTIFIYDRDDGRGLRIDFDANPSLYTGEELQDHMNRFLRLIDALLAQPGLQIGQIDLLDQPERARMLTDWNATNRPVPELMAFQQFEERAAQQPDAVAVSFGDVTLSYRDLNARANIVAHTLIERGIGPGAIVALVLPRTESLPAALLGTMKSGAAYLPIDPDFPADRIAAIMEDARPAVVLTTKGLAACLPVDGPDRILFDQLEPAEDADWFSDCNPTNADRTQPLSQAHTAYVIYTSGSTGKPKGVVVSHRNLVNFLRAMQDELALLRHDRLLAVTTISFDIAALEMYAPLLAGARVVIATREMARDPVALAREMERTGVTVMQATPSLWQSMVAVQPMALRGLRVLVGGEALPGHLARSLRQLGAAVTNLYGPTETTIWSTSIALDDGDLDNPPIGRPIANTQLYVLDVGLQPVPVGRAGQLYIGGVGVADGYLNRPSLTAERFVANPYGQPGSRFYRTGDLASWRRDGTLEFLGRIDHQVKVRGFRIETGDVEAALMRTGRVERAVVTAWDEPPAGKRLVAYVVPAAGGVVDENDLRGRLEAILPDYMIPSLFVSLSTLPMTPNGKVDRKALPAPSRSAPISYVAPRTATEAKLAALWTARLGLGRVGIHDNFFTIGGDSLVAAQLIADVQKAFGREMSLATMFHASTIAELAEQLDRDEAHDPLASLLPLRAGAKDLALFCIHPVVGLSWAYGGLLRHLGGECAVYGLQARGIGGDKRLPESLEEMADDYLAQIRQVQPRGPYHLLGWSLGGVVAFAIAQRLRSAGEQVAFLTLLDAYPFIRQSVDQEPEEAVLAKAALRFLGYEPNVLGDAPLGMTAVADFLCREYDILGNPLVKQIRRSNDEIVESVLAVVRNNLALLRKYVPGRIDVDMLFLRASAGKVAELDSFIDQYAAAWQPYVGGRIDEHQIDCHHQQMLDPGPVDEVGRIVAEEFAKRARRME
ncbi:non-ribosomal peptide synthetase [Telmatospirillum siberiense]|uniref:non-ribosomal peptide synthetase n=1 Tax=Telmatospirillum siberiense TaxID=382514 RepID=UPI0013046EEC|nr:non-ribosomal peptide synthetase [Telmatospirillum siberiense]